MRGPSRQTTTRLVAGARGRAATARARSATTSPSAPSATPDERQRPARLQQFGGRLGEDDLAIVRRSPGWPGSRAGAGTAGRHATPARRPRRSATPEVRRRGHPSGFRIRSGPPRSSCSMLPSAKRPRIRSISRSPRCQARNRSLRRRTSNPSLERAIPLIRSSMPKARTGRAAFYSGRGAHCQARCMH